jgi:hypothetical protein
MLIISFAEFAVLMVVDDRAASKCVAGTIG